MGSSQLDLTIAFCMQEVRLTVGRNLNNKLIVIYAGFASYILQLVWRLIPVPVCNGIPAHKCKIRSGCHYYVRVSVHARMLWCAYICEI